MPAFRARSTIPTQVRPYSPKTIADSGGADDVVGTVDHSPNFLDGHARGREIELVGFVD